MRKLSVGKVNLESVSCAWPGQAPHTGEGVVGGLRSNRLPAAARRDALFQLGDGELRQLRDRLPRSA